MANNLEKAKRALSGKRKFRITLEESETFDVEVEAKSVQEAKELALTMHSNGDSNSQGNSGANVIETKELTDEDDE